MTFPAHYKHSEWSEGLVGPAAIKHFQSPVVCAQEPFPIQRVAHNNSVFVDHHVVHEEAVHPQIVRGGGMESNEGGREKNR